MNNKEATKQVAEVVAGWRKAGLHDIPAQCARYARQYRQQAREAKGVEQQLWLRAVAAAYQKEASNASSISTLAK